MGKIIDALRRLGTKMTGKSTVDSNSIATVLNDIADDYEGSGGGETVVANPTLSGDEPELTGLEVDGTKYKVPEGGNNLYRNKLTIFVSYEGADSNYTFEKISSNNINITNPTDEDLEDIFNLFNQVAGFHIDAFGATTRIYEPESLEFIIDDPIDIYYNSLENALIKAKYSIYLRSYEEEEEETISYMETIINDDPSQSKTDIITNIEITVESSPL